MPLLPDVSIKRKQMFIIMLTSSVALLLACAAFVAYDFAAFRQEIKRNLQGLALRIAEQNTGNLTFEDHESAEATLKNILRDDVNIISGSLYDKNARIFARYTRAGEEQTPPSVPPEAGFYFSPNRMSFVHKVTLSGEVIGNVFLESDRQILYQRLARYGGISLVVLILSTIVALILSSQLQRVISAPILHLVETAKQVSTERNYKLRVVKHGKDELGNLIDHFNEMLSQIQQRDAALQTAHDQLEKRVEDRTRDLQMQILERMRAEKNLQQQFARLSLLNHITRSISESQDLNSILLVVLRQLEDHLPIDFGAVLLFNAENETFTAASVKVKLQTMDAALQMREKQIFTVAETGLGDCVAAKTLYAKETTGIPARLLEMLAAAGLHSAVAVPLLVENKLFGVLLGARRHVDAFDGGDCEFFRMLSDHVALAAHQARLHAQLRQAYEELRQTQQAVMQQERLRALGKMASGIAHDINNALSPIIVYSELLLRSETGLSDNAGRHLNNIKTAGEDIAHIVARMREFYRKREQTDDFTPIKINDLVLQVIDLTRPRWRDIPQQKGTVVNMQTDLEASVPDFPGNGPELREALTNLILNAVDAMPIGGHLTIRTRHRPAVEQGDCESQLIVEVADTGLGMDDETRARCLEPFFSTKGKRGTGLGLAMVYGIMERHEGTIEIDSTPGKGTTMRLIFRVRPMSTARIKEMTVPETVPPLRILYVDDEPLLRELLKETLEAEGHSVAVADNGQSGIATFKEASAQQPFEIVITDLGMPYIDGRQVANTIKKDSPHTPIVLLTGWGNMLQADGEKITNVDAIVSKPPRIGELRSVLYRLTQKT